MIEGWYDVHGLIKIYLKVGDLNPARLIDPLLASFRSEPMDASSVDLEFLDSVEQPDYSNSLKAGEFYYRPGDQSVWDDNGLVRSEPSGKISVFSDWGSDNFVLTLLMLNQLVRQGFALCHGMGVVVGDKAVIFPAWHLSGKTGLFSFMPRTVSTFAFSRSWIPTSASSAGTI